MTTVTDETLMRSLAAGRDDALRELMGRHRGRVLGYFVRRLPCFEDAEEATQDVFLKIRRGAGTFNGGAFGPWCGAIARNVLRDRLRRHHGPLEVNRFPGPCHAGQRHPGQTTNGRSSS